MLRDRRGVRVKHLRTTDAIRLNQLIAPLLAARIKMERKARGWTLVQFAERLGWTEGNPKERVWAIENATRGQGIRLGTIFLIGRTLGIPWRDLLPDDAAVEAAFTAKESPKARGKR